MYSPLHASRLYEQVINQIEALIQEGKLRAGDRLPAERELSEQFGVSRTVVREAVKALREKGLVQIQPGKGTYITDGTSEVMRQSISLMVKIDQRKGLANLMQVREMLEPEIAAIAARYAAAEELEEMKSAIEAMDEALEDAEAYIEADQQFHHTLAKAANNELILRLIDPIVDLLREQRIQVFYAGSGGAENGQIHHKQIFDAIQNGDSEAARQAMIAHLKQVRRDSGVTTAD
ncbi:MAG TPA: FadR/GntR family transcriptional regulator [Aggregatilineales bacterium]|nr:FadR/GntR family transcriptional regulator [Aggregatilineales bacterium]